MVVFCSFILQTAVNAHVSAHEKPVSRIQLCLILDVSGSMDGLLYQAQTQIWSLLDYTKAFERKSRETVVEIALITVGNGPAYQEQGFINIDSDFTTHRDSLADKLFLLKTIGSSEQYGNAIHRALNTLTWDKNSDFKTIIILGNEEFDQGKVDYLEACRKAADLDIIINTIYCGDWQKGIDTYWEEASKTGKGAYTHIDQSSQANLATPFDSQVFRMYGKYLLTYGDSSVVKLLNKMQKKQVSPAYRDMLLYRLGQQKIEKDIIDLFEDSDWNLDQINPEFIPDDLKELGDRGLKEYLVKKAQERYNAKDAIAIYRKKINEYIAMRAEASTSGKTLKDATQEILGTQLKARKFKKKG